MSEQPEFQYDVFVSYADADAAWVEGYLMDALDGAEIDFHSEEAFALGVPRLVEFERAIKSSRRTLLILSQAYLADQFSEFTDLLAQTYGLETGIWPVIPVILHPVDLPARLQLLGSLDATSPEQWDRVVERLCRELSKPLPPPPPIPACPYPGMVPFGEADSHRFFGRERQVSELIERLRLHPFITVIGASGSGKSSLVFAGLLPALRKSRYFDGGWQVRSLRPGDAPMERLQQALESDPSTAQGLFNPVQTVQNLLAACPGDKRLLLIVDQFEELFTLCEGCADDFQAALLSLAQVEACYIVLTVRADFYADLMTSDLWSEIQSHRIEILPMDEKGLRQCIHRPAEDVGVYMDAALIERLIKDAAGEPGVLPLVQETLVLLWGHVKRRFLPLLSYEALVLSRADYGGLEVTGLQVAMARRADAALDQLLPEQQAIARRAFIRLVQFGEGRSDTRRQQPLSRLRGANDNALAFRQTLDHLVDNRLLMLSGEEGETDKKVDIAHEALIRGWPRLQAWLNQRRDAEQTRRRMESKAAEWLRLDKKGGLLEEVELLEAEQWLNSPDAVDLGYDQSVLDLVDASRETLRAAEREREESRQRELEAARRLAEEAAERERIQAAAARQLRRRAWILAAIGVVAAALAVLSFIFFTQAQTERYDAESRTLASDALNYLDSDAALSLQLALTAFDVSKTTQAQDALREVLISAYPWRALIDTGLESETSHEDAVRIVAWSHDGQYLASASYDGTIKIWDREGKLLTTLVGHGDKVRGIDWRLDDVQIVSASYDGTIRIWDVAEKDQRWIGHTAVLQTWDEGHPNTVEWSPDSRLLLVSGSDGSVRIVDAGSGETPVAVYDEPGNEVNKAAWSPDGARFAYASDDKTIKIWVLRDLLASPDRWTEIASTVVLTGHTGYVLDVDWSPDGSRLASAAYDGIRIWNAGGGPSIDRLVGHEAGEVRSVDWSPDGTLLLSASVDKSIRVWNVSTGASIAKLTGHKDWVFDARWHPQERLIASASLDRMVRVWTLARPSVDILTGYSGEVRRVAWSPDGTLLAAGDDAGRLALWNAGEHFAPFASFELDSQVIGLGWAAAGAPLTALGREGAMVRIDGTAAISFMAHLPDDYAYTLAWSADGARLATVSSDGSVKLWERAAIERAAQGEDITAQAYAQLPLLQDDWFVSVAWSPDASQLATGSWQGQIHVWDAQTLENTVTVTGHDGIAWGVAWHPDGDHLVSVSQDTTVLFWDLDKPEEPAAGFYGHIGAVNDVQVSPDGTQFATASDDGAVRIWDWDTKSGDSIARLSGPDRGIWSVAWSPDGKRIAAAVMDGTVWVFYADFQDVLDIALKQQVSPLTQREVEQYFE
ncbi:MAG: TIR domain-containing protein [Anaerolineae bacterium]|nr:TIR domain-containing protein [Anaerolineae bacterium]